MWTHRAGHCGRELMDEKKGRLRVKKNGGNGDGVRRKMAVSWAEGDGRLYTDVLR